MPTMRAYIGPFVFILFFSITVVMGTFIIHLKLIPSFLSIVLVVVSLVVLAVLYRVKATLPQKEFIRVFGEVYLCLLAGAGLSLILLVVTRVSIPLYLLGLLFILCYHFIINKRTFKDFNIRAVSNNTEFLIVSVIGLFCLFGVINLNELVESTLHFPSFENIVSIFLVVVAEEVAYRYYIQKTGEEAFGTYGTVLVTTALLTLSRFFATSLDVLLLVYYVITNLTFGYGYARDKNLSIPLILHGIVSLFPYFFF